MRSSENDSPTVSVKTWSDIINTVHQEIQIKDEITKTIIEVARRQEEEQIRQALMRLGWTPPQETSKVTA